MQPDAPSRYSPGPIILPTRPEQPRRAEFPVLASTAPVLGSLVMWAITQSPFALVFAILGPVVAVAGLADARLHRRRSSKAERERFARDLKVAAAAIEREHEAERAAIRSQVFEPTDLLTGTARDPDWWRDSLDGPLPICLGWGTIPSSLRIDGDGAPIDAGAVEESLTVLRRAAAQLPDAPVVVDARRGIGVYGPTVPAEALGRAIVAQLIARLPPNAVEVSCSNDGVFWWVSRTPHARRPGHDSRRGRVVFRPVDHNHGPRPADIVCAVVRNAGELPRGCRIVVNVGGGGAAVVIKNPDGPPVRDLRPHFVSEGQAVSFADDARECAVADGMVPALAALPDRLALADLGRIERAAPGRLPATIALAPDGPVAVDLVADGPHAIVGGMTGSGKSELLISWVLAMAGAVSPDEVNFLLVDFKGGSAFSSVQNLPHTTGVITDLDEAEAGRALASLRAELRFRERRLAKAGARGIDELRDGDRLPRLVIVVDEFAVVVGEFPELHALFSDLAARGRSLGIHLILCTQRPGGVVRDSVLANCTLRLSLRVNNRADSLAVIGSGVAAELPRLPSGRCYLSIGEGAPELVQIALADAADVAAVTRGWSWGPPPRRPWCDPLPERVPPSSLASVEVGLAFGLTDLPEEQSQPTAVYDPDRHGNLIVIGGQASGKSGLLAALDSAGNRSVRQVIRVGPDIEDAWDLVVGAASDASAPPGRARVYLLDDVDVMLGRFGDDHQYAFGEMLAGLLREGPRGARMVLTTGRLTSAVQQLAALCDSRLILRMPARQEHLLAGGDTDNYSAELPPGAGFWLGHRVQIAWAPEQSRPSDDLDMARGRLPVQFGAGTAIVTGRPRAFAQRLRALTGEGSVSELAAPRPGELSIGHGEGAILVADPATWQSQWALFAATRSRMPVLFDGCSVAEFRALTGSRTLPPPIGAAPGGAWLLDADGTTRVQLPPGLAAPPANDAGFR